MALLMECSSKCQGFDSLFFAGHKGSMILQSAFSLGVPTPGIV